MPIPQNACTCKTLDEDSTITIEELQDLARRGKLRWRIFGEVAFYGFTRERTGDLEKAARELPGLIERGMVRLYVDADGIFLGPLNPHFVETPMFLGNPDVDNALANQDCWGSA